MAQSRTEIDPGIGELEAVLADGARAIDETAVIPAAVAAAAGGLVPEPLVPLPVAATAASIDRLARASGAVGWCVAWWAQCAHQLSAWDRATRRSVAASPNRLVSAPAGPGEGWLSADGDVLRLWGAWPAVVGREHVGWIIVPARGVDGHAVRVLVEADACREAEPSRLGGLRGAVGSAVVADGVPVDARRVVAEPVSGDERSYLLLAAVVGMARGAVEAFEERLRAGSANAAGTPLADIPTMHLRLARADCQVECAEGLLHDDLMRRTPAPYQVPVPADDATHRQLLIARLAVDAVSGLFEVSGASGLALAAPIQRIHRDVKAAVRLSAPATRGAAAGAPPAAARTSSAA